MTANDTIRRAADAIGLAAAGAKCSAAGRWYVHAPEGGGPQRILDNAVLIAHCHQDGPPTSARYIAAFDPTVAFSVARILEAAAEADLKAVHAAAAQLAVDFLQETARCEACGRDVSVDAEGALVEHGTMAAMCPGGSA